MCPGLDLFVEREKIRKGLKPMTMRFQISVYLFDRVSANFDSAKNRYYVKNEQQYRVELHFGGEKFQNTKNRKINKRDGK